MYLTHKTSRGNDVYSYFPYLFTFKASKFIQTVNDFNKRSQYHWKVQQLKMHSCCGEDFSTTRTPKINTGSWKILEVKIA